MATLKTTRAEVEFGVTLMCSECGTELDGEFTERIIGFSQVYRELSVGPCEKCTKEK